MGTQTKHRTQRSLADAMAFARCSQRARSSSSSSAARCSIPTKEFWTVPARISQYAAKDGDFVVRPTDHLNMLKQTLTLSIQCPCGAHGTQAARRFGTILSIPCSKSLTENLNGKGSTGSPIGRKGREKQTPDTNVVRVSLGLRRTLEH